MPVLPTYTAQRNINANVAEPLRNESAQPFQDTQKVLAATQEVAQKWSDAQDVMQSTDAKGKYKVEMAKLLSQAEQDTDFRNIGKYKKEIDAIKSKSLDGINNSFLRNSLSAEIDFENQITSSRLDVLFRKKEIDYTRAVSLPATISGYQSGMVNASTNADYQMNKELLFQKIDENAQAGVINFSEAEKLKKDSMYGAAESAVYSNPEEGMNQINSGRYDLTAEEKSKLTETSRNLIKHRDELEKWQAKQSNIQGSFQLSQALYNKTLTHQMVKDLQQSNIIDADTAAIFDAIALKKNYEIPSSTSLAEPDYFAKLIEDSVGDKIQVEKILKDAATAYGENKLGSNQYLYLIQQANEAFDRQSKGLNGMSKTQSAMKYAVDGLKSYANIMSKTPPILLFNLLTKFTDRVKPGDDPEKIKTQVIDEHLGEEIEKSKSSLKPNGIVMISPDGRRGIMPNDNVEKALKRGYKYAE